MKKGPECRQAGFTLFEVVIATSIASAIGILLLLLILNSTNVSYSQSSKVEQGVKINDALSKIREQIKESSGVALNYPESGSALYTTGTTQLILKVLSRDNSGNIIANTFDYFVFFKDEDKLRLKSYPDPQSQRKSADQILAGNVQSALFQYLNTSMPPDEVTPQSALKVRITLVLREKAGVNYQSSVATSEANIRND